MNIISKKRKKIKLRQLRGENYRKDFVEPGTNPKKYFGNLLTRYGVRGYHLGRKIGPNETKIVADFFFPSRGIAVFVGQDLTDSQLEYITKNRLLPICVPGELDVPWMQAVSRIQGIAVDDLSPVHKWCFKQAEVLEHR